MFGFDPEVPAGFQDADIEMLELAEAADELAALCDSGNHEWHTNLAGNSYCVYCSARK